MRPRCNTLSQIGGGFFCEVHLFEVDRKCSLQVDPERIHSIQIGREVLLCTPVEYSLIKQVCSRTYLWHSSGSHCTVPLSQISLHVISFFTAV